MLRVTVEIVPFGDEEEKQLLGTMEIINDGSGDGRIGNYIIRRDDAVAAVHDYPRKAGFWELTRQALNKLGAQTLDE